MAATLDTLSQILKDIYMGPPRIEAVKVTVWTCSKHKHPVLDKYESVCLAAEALGGECEDLDECPHVVERKVKDGCTECKGSRYEDVLDYETVKMDETGFVYGDPVYVAKMFTTMEWELSRPSMVLLSAMQSEVNKGLKVTIPLTLKERDGESA